jgi:hypothetical protein
MSVSRKHYEIQDGINNPLPLSNLDEAVEWLTKATNENWTKRKLIAFVFGLDRDIKVGELSDSHLKVKLPRGLRIGAYGYSQDLNGGKEILELYSPLCSGIYKRFEMESHLTADLEGRNIFELLHYGETDITCVGVQYFQEKVETIYLIEPVDDHSDNPTGKNFIDGILNQYGGRMPAYYVAGIGSPLKVTEEMVCIKSQDLKVLTDLSRRIKPEIAASSVRKDGYKTKEFEILEEAMQKFWRAHDPNKPPKKHEVMDWLTNEHGIGKRMAEVMDTIIRSTQARKGGNKSRQIKIKPPPRLLV